MNSDSEILEEIIDDCEYTTRNIAEFDDPSKRAKEDGLRHVQTIQQINEYIKSNDQDRIRILNASGVAYGSQDIPIKSYIDRHHSSLSVEWYAIESPQSEYLNDENLINMCEKSDVRIVPADLKEVTWEDFDSFDIVLFTEIAEHLDYSTFLSTLISIKEVLVPGGILIFTTPNKLRAKNRIKILFGNDDIYWGDSVENMESGLFGHITYYGPNRLERLLTDVGLEVETISGFNALSAEVNDINGLLQRALQIISFPTQLKEYLFVVARKTK